MKKLLPLYVLMVATTAASGQVVIFNNSSTTLISTNGYFGTSASGPISGPIPSYYFGLFVAPANILTSTGWDDPDWTFTGCYATNRTTAGRIRGGIVSVGNYAPGTEVNLLVRGWSADWGADWAGVKQKLDSYPWWGQSYGESEIGFNIVLGGGAYPYPPVFGHNPGQIDGFTLQPIPEPCAPALLIFGAAMIGTRRKRA